MSDESKNLEFQKIHIEVARNATDDFNPFHDKHKWQRIRGNPFAGPIVLGFQLETLIAHHIRRLRLSRQEQDLLQHHGLGFSNYQFTFASAVHCGQSIEIDIKKSRVKEGANTTLSNRISVRADGQLALLGYQRESQQALFVPQIDIAGMQTLSRMQDRALVPGTEIFLKRKYMLNSNAKNLLTGSLVEQSLYFDELEDHVQYPEMYPCSLISCALLEKVMQEGHNFYRNPMVYTSHKISIDRQYLAQLRSNDTLHILVRRLTPHTDEHIYECVGVIGDTRILYRAVIALTPLTAISGVQSAGNQG